VVKEGASGSGSFVAGDVSRLCVLFGVDVLRGTGDELMLVSSKVDCMRKSLAWSTVYLLLPPGMVF